MTIERDLALHEPGKFQWRGREVLMRLNGDRACGDDRKWRARVVPIPKEPGPPAADTAKRHRTSRVREDRHQ
jgi:hypothetical protein